LPDPLPDLKTPMPIPALRTERLVLRPFTLADAADVQRLAGAAEVADTTLNIPHPYENGMAEAWIETHWPSFERRELAVFAITEADGPLLGAVSLRLEPAHQRAELGYWVGVPYWGRGYATEAAVAIIRYGFELLDLHRVYATHLVRNPASGRVLLKAGMTYEGCHRQHARKQGRFEDLAGYAILRTDPTSGAPTESVTAAGVRLRVQDGLRQLPGPGGERFVSLLRHGTLEVELYAPRSADPQTPHRRDEVYVVARGRGEFVVAGTRQHFDTGDLLFVPAGVEHRFETFTDDLVVWVLFYGPDDGE
jgi:RimJ/RimL family protein N-acetyltransferase